MNFDKESKSIFGEGVEVNEILTKNPNLIFLGGGGGGAWGLGKGEVSHFIDKESKSEKHWTVW